MPPRRGGLISVDQAWQAVSLEERLELISKAQASGILASIATMLLVGSIAYGFDKVWLLVAGIAGSSFVYPLFSSYSWRKEKPALILAYLAVRSMARRYAFAYNLGDLDIVFIYRAAIKEIFQDRSAAELARQRQDIDGSSFVDGFKDVWVILMRSGVVFLSERDGGAKMEFITSFGNEAKLRKPAANEAAPDDRALVLEGAGFTKGRTVLLTSRYPGAHYVFEKKFQGLLEEQRQFMEAQERIRSNLQPV
ncbi:MAG TPA: hypothetical protein PLP17_10135 [Oligoflexia bacterium]|mgnify:CR=1 FL=1|nr:hypothetical protein [Oligoflexia bacterium]